jgi:hypothetical protein
MYLFPADTETKKHVRIGSGIGEVSVKVDVNDEEWSASRRISVGE